MNEIVYFVDTPGAKAEMLLVNAVQDRIKREQILQQFTPRMKELYLGQQYELFCYDRNQETEVPRYTLTVIDSNDAKVLKKRSCAAFITPQGKERDTMISTQVGKISLCN